MTTNKHLIDEQAMAERLGVTRRTVRHWRTTRVVPYLKIGRIILFDPAKVFEALEAFERISGEKRGPQWRRQT